MQFELRGVSMQYPGGVRALGDLSTTISPGVTGLLGPNGAGKSTLMLLLVGLARPTAGTIQLNGADLTGARPALYQRLGYVPQRFTPYPSLTVREFLTYVATLKRIEPKTARHQRVEQVLSLLHLEEVQARRTAHLSGGTRQRLGLAQALLNEPDVLILDEPTAGLDPDERLHFRRIIAGLGQHRTVIVSSHILGDLAQTCERLVVLEQGRLLYHGAVDALVAKALGSVWEMELPETQVDQVSREAVVISTRRAGDRVLVRAASLCPIGPGARPVEPTLEDAYIWLRGASVREGGAAR